MQFKYYILEVSDFVSFEANYDYFWSTNTFWFSSNRKILIRNESGNLWNKLSLKKSLSIKQRKFHIVRFGCKKLFSNFEEKF